MAGGHTRKLERRWRGEKMEARGEAPAQLFWFMAASLNGLARDDWNSKVEFMLLGSWKQWRNMAGREKHLTCKVKWNYAKSNRKEKK